MQYRFLLYQPLVELLVTTKQAFSDSSTMYSRVAPLRKGAYRPSMACASLSRRAETIFFSCLDFYLRNQLAGLPHFSVRNTRTLLVADWPKRLPLSLRHASRDPPSEQGIGGFIAKLLPRGVRKPRSSGPLPHVFRRWKCAVEDVPVAFGKRLDVHLLSVAESPLQARFSRAAPAF